MKRVPRFTALLLCWAMALFGVSLGVGCEEQLPEPPGQQQPQQPQQPADNGNGGDEEEGEDDTEPIMPMPQQQ